MREKIETLLEKKLRYLEINVKNGDTYTVYEPNKEGSGNTFEILDEEYIKWVQHVDDGCTYENYFRISEIIFVTGLYNCPEAVGTLNGDEIDERF